MRPNLLRGIPSTNAVGDQETRRVLDAIIENVRYMLNSQAETAKATAQTLVDLLAGAGVEIEKLAAQKFRISATERASSGSSGANPLTAREVLVPEQSGESVVLKTRMVNCGESYGDEVPLGVGATMLEDLTDVSMVGRAKGSFLYFNGNEEAPMWYPSTGPTVNGDVAVWNQDFGYWDIYRSTELDVVTNVEYDTDSGELRQYKKTVRVIGEPVTPDPAYEVVETAQLCPE